MAARTLSRPLTTWGDSAGGLSRLSVSDAPATSRGLTEGCRRCSQDVNHLLLTLARRICIPATPGRHEDLLHQALRICYRESLPSEVVHCNVM